MALPLLLEGEVVGMLVAGRHALDTFSAEDLQRAKAVAFWTAATLVDAVRDIAPRVGKPLSDDEVSAVVEYLKTL